jgi:hypothetical protein
MKPKPNLQIPQSVESSLRYRLAAFCRLCLKMLNNNEPAERIVAILTIILEIAAPLDDVCLTISHLKRRRAVDDRVSELFHDMDRDGKPNTLSLFLKSEVALK